MISVIKAPFVIALLTLILSQQAFSQFSSSQQKMVNYLLAKKHINKNEVDKLCADSFIACLNKVYKKRYFHQVLGGNWSSFINRNSVKKTTKLLAKFYENDIINKATFEFANSKTFDQNEGRDVIYTDFQLITFLYEKQQFDKTRFRVKEYLSKLQRLEIIDSVIDIQNLSIKNNEQILGLFNQRIRIDSSFLKGPIDQQYKALHRHVANELGFNLSDYEFKVVAQQFGEYEFELAQCRFKCNGNLYESVNSYKMGADGNARISLKFFEVFNKVLVDEGSEKRLFAPINQPKHEFNLLLLDSNQYHFLKKSSRKSNKYFDLDWYKVIVSKYASAFDLLSRKEIINAFYVFDSIGLNHKGIEMNDSISLQNFKTNEQILEQMADIMLGFDWEMFEYDAPYTYAIKEFASKTNGELIPENINENFSFDNDMGWVSFEYNGKTYKTEFEIMGDWYDGAFLELIEKAIEENNLSGRFYYLPDGGQASAHIWLTPSQYNYLSKTNLIHFGKN